MADPKGRYSETAAIIIFFTFNRSLGQYFSLYSECYFTPVRRQHLSRKKKKLRRPRIFVMWIIVYQLQTSLQISFSIKGRPAIWSSRLAGIVYIYVCFSFSVELRLEGHTYNILILNQIIKACV